MLRATSLVLCFSLSAAGCGQMTSRGRTASVAGGLALVAIGAIVATPTEVDSDHNGRNDWILNDDFSGLFPGALMVAGGITLVIAGLTSSSAEEKPAAAPVIAPAAPGLTVTAAPTAVTAPTAPIAAAAAAPLPELPVNEPTLRAGKQIRAAATFGQCEHAWVMLRGLRDAQPAYAAALVDGPVMSPCVRK